ncbi:MAG TPA: hypothetical protein VK403_00540 [Allosphingosinicella sp.]|nr:hypothetical protein [Allosphingosinicella sp.]
MSDRVATLRKDDFYLPTLQVLEALGGSASIEEIEEKLIEEGVGGEIEKLVDKLLDG